MDQKFCRGCGTHKPLTDFYKHRTHSDGLSSRCKACAQAAISRARMRPKDYGTPVGTKPCEHCKIAKPLSDFPRNKRHHDGRHHICKACNYARHAAYSQTPEGKAKIAAGRYRRYWADPNKAREIRANAKIKAPVGIYYKLLAAQSGVCAICGTNENKGKFRFALDHNHATGAVRGLLCTCCNQALGQLRDSPDLLRRAAAYLEDPPANHL